MSHYIIDRRIIKFNEKYHFALVEEKESLENHPISQYYFKLNDLSINIVISFKWIEWAYEFFSSLSQRLKELDSSYNNINLIEKAIQKNNLLNVSEEEHVLLIDDFQIKKKEDLIKLIENFYFKELFGENAKIHFKLKINLREYLIISNELYPTFIRIT